MIHSVYITDSQGEPIIEKHYRGTVHRSELDHFASTRPALPAAILAAAPPAGPPVAISAHSALAHVFRGGLYLVAATREGCKEMCPATVVAFLHGVADLFEDYFGELNEHAIKDNFVTVYEILDEVLDYGFPLTTDPNALKRLIPPPSIFRRVVSSLPTDSLETPPPPSLPNFSSALSRAPWRISDPSPKYAQNEIFVDIIERVSAVILPSGHPLVQGVAGEVVVDCRLSGMPEVTLEFSRGDVLENVGLHRCVRRSKEGGGGAGGVGKVLRFVPPDGRFELMRYAAGIDFAMPLDLRAKVEYRERDHGGTVNVLVSSTIRGAKKGEDACGDALVRVYFPEQVMGVSASSAYGTVKFDPRSKICLWTIGTIPDGRTVSLTGTLSLDPARPVPRQKPTVSADFVAQQTVSGLSVQRLDISGESYKAFKGLKCTLQAGNYEFRSG